jgi:predicted dehydrogenase
VDRRTFISRVAPAGAVLASFPEGAFDPARTGARVAYERDEPRPRQGAPRRPPVRCAAVGLNHGHINSQVATVLRNGGELVWVYAREPELVAAFTKRFPQARVARSEQEVLDDPSIQLVVSAAIPDERAGLGIRVMQHGKDYLVDKPGVTALEQLAEVRRVQAATRRIYSVLYGGRLESPATERALALVREGAIGEVVQTVGLGPHRVNAPGRPEWFWDRRRFGGVLCDLATHQTDDFLAFTGSTQVEVVASQADNLRHPEHPQFEDFGDAMVRGDRGSGYFRVDWLSPDGLPVFGDSRLTVIGTAGYLEIRKTIDIAGRPNGNHLFLADAAGVRYIECADTPLPFGARLVADIHDRTETAMTQAHCFLATELALRAQAQAQPARLRTASK